MAVGNIDEDKGRQKDIIMKAASLKEIKEELEHLPQNALLAICLRLIKFKKENKELLSYLLFDAGNETEYSNNINLAIDALFAEVNTKSIYIAKKNIRKIVRFATRFIKYSDAAATETEVLIHVAKKMKMLTINWQKTASVVNIYQSLLKKINKSIANMHEDMQHDYLKEINTL